MPDFVNMTSVEALRYAKQESGKTAEEIADVRDQHLRGQQVSPAGEQLQPQPGNPSQTVRGNGKYPHP